MMTNHNAVYDPAMYAGNGGWRSLSTADLAGMAVTSGNVQVAVPGTGPVVAPSQVAKRVVVSNINAHTVDVTQGGVAFKMPANSMMTFEGLSNLNQLTFTDGQAAATVYYLRWSR